jgi:thiamine-monophosphate kinase
MKAKARSLRALGEDAVLARITRDLILAADVRVGPGDDCAVIGSPRDHWWSLLKTDVVVEGVHFDSKVDPARVGWKALARALSDIAAMGGVPGHALITVVVNKNAPVPWIDGLYRGLRRASKRFGVSIVGGELSHSPGPAVINVALTGRVERKRCALRSGGKAGDDLFVTGRLGGSIAGKHLEFVPKLEEARWLVEHFTPSAMMDLSDGLGSDLPRLAAASGCAFQLDEAAIPRTPGCTLQQALTDGEDFELLFAMPRKLSAKLEAAWKREFPRLPLTRIGVLTAPGRGVRSFGKGIHGHDHFA